MQLTDGLGANGDPEIRRQLREIIEDLFAQPINPSLVFLTATKA
jgi:hypothetical protein